MATSPNLNKKNKRKILKEKNMKECNLKIRIESLKARKKINQQCYLVVKKTELMKVMNMILKEEKLEGIKVEL